MKIRVILARSIAALFVTSPLFAATFTWDGGSLVDSNLSTAANWNPDGAPVSDLVNTNLVFGGTARLAPNVSAAFSANSITFNNTAAANAFSVGGTTLNIGAGGIVNNDADTMTFTNFLSFGGVANSTINAANGGLTFTNGIALATGTTTIDGPGTTSFFSLGGAGTVMKQGTGTMNWALPSSATFLDFNIAAGTVNTVADGTTDLFNISGSIAVNGTSTFNINENLTLDGAPLTRATGATMTLAAGKTLRLQNGADATITGSFTDGTASTIIVTGAGSTFTISGISEFRGGSVLNITAGGSVSGGSYIDLANTAGNATVLVDGAGSSFSSGGGSYWGFSGNTALVTFSNGASGSVGDTTVTNASAGSVGTVNVLSGSTLTFGNLQLANHTGSATATLTVNGAGSLVTLTGGSTLNIGGASGSVGTLNVQSGGTFNSGTGTTTVNATGTVAITGGTFNQNGNMTVNGQLTRDVAGLFNLAAGKTLTVQNGGDAIFSGGYFQTTAATVNVTGAGSTFTMSGPSEFRGGSTLNITAGGSVSGGSFIDLGGNATVLVDGAGSSFSSGAGSYWGFGGNTALVTFSNGASGSVGNTDVTNASAGSVGTVNVLSGSTLTFGNLTLANHTGSATATLTVNGAGSLVTLTGGSTLNIGGASGSVGTLNVQNSGLFSTNATGTTTVNATGTVAITGGTFNQNGNMTVNGGKLTRDAAGSFNLAAGKALTLQNGGDANFTVNDAQSFTGSNLTVTGVGSTFNSPGLGAVVVDSGANFSVQAGGSVGFGGTLRIGNAGTATASVDGTGSSLTAYEITLQGSGASSLTLSNNAVVNSVDFSITSGVGTSNSVSISSGADLTVDNLVVGNSSGTANLALNGGGSSITAQQTIITSAGAVTIDGGTFTSNGLLYVNGGFLARAFNAALILGGGAGTLLVANGGDVIIGGDFGDLSGANISVTGIGSTFSATGGLAIQGGGTVNVTSGGKFTTSVLNIGNNPSGGSLSVSGPGSTLIVSPSFYTSLWGNSGTANVSFSNEASVTINTPLGIGSSVTGSSASVTVQSGATVTSNRDVFVGLTAISGVAGSISVSGAGSSWTLAGTSSLIVGYTGEGTGILNITNGGLVSVGSGFGAQLYLNPTGTVNLDGGTLSLGNSIGRGGGVLNFNSGTLSIVDDFTVGTGGLLGTNVTLDATRTFITSATTTIDAVRTLTLNGGTFRTGALVNNGILAFNSGTLGITGAGGFNIGTGALGSIVTLGTGANLQVTNTTTVASGALLRVNGGSFSGGAITNNGTIDHQDGVLDFTGTLNNAAGSRLFVGGLASPAGAITNEGRITMQNGIGLLGGAGAITNTGVITGEGTISKPVTNSASGQLRAESGKTLTFTSAITANAGTLSLQGGTLEFTSAITNSATGFVSGRGSLITTGITNNGQMAFSGGNADVYGDTTNAAGGRIVTSGAGSTTTFFDDVIHNGTEIFTGAGASSVFFGSLSGAGPFTGTGTVYSIGDLRPGNSPATVTYGGGLVLGTSTTLTMELGGRTKGTQYDSLNVAGSFAADGILALSLINGFAPALGDMFDLFNFASITGTFDSFVLPALAQYLAWNTSALYTNGEVSVTTTLTPIEQWRLLHFGSPANSGDGADDNDFDKDGTKNLLEYALGLDPLVPSTAGLPSLSVVTAGANSHIALTVTRPLSATDITYQIEVGGALVSFLPGSSYSSGGDLPSNANTTQVSRTPDGSGNETIVIRDNTPLAGSPSRFLRLKVSLP